MVTLPLSTRVLVCREPVDMRRSFDGLEAAVRERLRENPLSGALFVFWSRRRDRLKILSFDGTGLWIWYKRLESGRFELPGQPGDGPEISSAPPPGSTDAIAGRFQPAGAVGRVAVGIQGGEPREGVRSEGATLPGVARLLQPLPTILRLHPQGRQRAWRCRRF